MEFGILGPLRVVRDDGTSPVFAPRPTRVLALLLARSGRVVSVEELVEAVWDDDPPATARRQLHNCVSWLRKEIVIAAERPGYRLTVQSGQLDAMVFAERVGKAQALAAQGHPGAAVIELRAALGLWRGDALAGLTGRTFEAIGARVNEQRLTAVEQCCELELGLGRHRDLTGELAELVARQPLRESLVGLLMRALHGSGQKAQALAAYQQLRTRLAEEMGIDPGDALRDLHARILRDEITLPSPPPEVIPRQLPAPLRHFVGRTGEIEELDALISGRTGVAMCVIVGSGGVGKTALAVYWAHRVADRFPDGQLYLNLHGFDPGGSPATPAEAMRALLDTLGHPAERVPIGLDAQAGLLRSLVAQRRMLLVLDNARDAAQVRPLLPGTPGCVVLITSRDRLGGLSVANGARAIRLGVLTRGESRELLARHLGAKRVAADPDAVGRIAEHCARLPLALAITAVLAAAKPAAPLGLFADDLTDTAVRLDLLTVGDENTRVRAVFSWSYLSLAAPAGRLFRMLGLHPGPLISLEAAASVAGEPVAVTRSLLAELLRAHLLEEPAPGRYACHDLLRAYAAELVHSVDTAEDRRAAVHRMLDHYLHTAHRADRVLYPAQDNWTLAPAQPAACPLEIPDIEAALAWFSAEYPVLLAIAHRTAQGWDRHTWQLACALTNFHYRHAYWDDMLVLQHAALAAARRLADPEAQILTNNNLSHAYARLGRHDEARRHLDDSLALAVRTGDRTRQAAAEHRLAFLAERQGQHDRGLAHARNALALYREIGHDAGEALGHNAVGWFYALLGDPEAITHCRQALALHTRLDNRTGKAHTWDSLGYAYHRIGKPGEAVACYHNSLALFQELGNRVSEADTLNHLGDAQLSLGDNGAARDSWRRAIAILDELDPAAAARIRLKLTAGAGDGQAQVAPPPTAASEDVSAA